MIEEKTMDELLEMIEKKFGAFSRDHLEHAGNVIDSNSKNAKEIRRRLIGKVKHLIRKVENKEVANVKRELYEMLMDLGVDVKKDNFWRLLH